VLPDGQQSRAEEPVLHEHYEAMFADMQTELRPRVIANLDPGDAKRFQDTDIRILRSPELLARAGYMDGKPTIQLSTALLQVIDQLGATSIHSNTLQVGPCHFEYQMYLRRRLDDGIRTISSIDSPTALATHACACTEYSETALRHDKTAALMLRGMFSQIALFIVLHETAHVLYRDIDHNGAYSADIEERADAWAINMMSRMGIGMDPVMPLMAFVMFFEESAAGQTSTVSAAADKRFDKAITLSAMRTRRLDRFTPQIREGAAKVIEGYRNFFLHIQAHEDAAAEFACATLRARIEDYGPIVANWMGYFHAGHP
jgi:predicted HD phosphohydrolase